MSQDSSTVDENSRTIPVASIADDFDASLRSHLQTLSPWDQQMVAELRNELIENGVLADNTSGFDSDDVVGFQDMLEKANAVAQNEQDFHPQYVHEPTNRELEHVEHIQGHDFETPLVDELDDTEPNQYASSTLVCSGNEGTNASTVYSRRENHLVTVRFPDGTIVTGHLL